MINIKYDDFKAHLESVVRINAFLDRLCGFCGEANQGRIDFELTFPSLMDDVVDLLKIATNDRDDWIGYWVYELNCGQKYKDGMVKEKDGRIVKLKTIEDLWNLIVKSDTT